MIPLESTNVIQTTASNTAAVGWTFWPVCSTEKSSTQECWPSLDGAVWTRALGLCPKSDFGKTERVSGGGTAATGKDRRINQSSVSVKNVKSVKKMQKDKKKTKKKHAAWKPKYLHTSFSTQVKTSFQQVSIRKDPHRGQTHVMRFIVEMERINTALALP